MKKTGCGCLVIILMMMMFPVLMMAAFLSGDIESVFEDQSPRIRCSLDEINLELWETAFERAGVLRGRDHLVIEASEKWGIDPVLFASIIFHETGWGTSSAIVFFNNPGGLMGANGLMRFGRLEDGLEVMGRTLHNHIHERGATTLEALRDIYAPLGADNDPTGLNDNWVSTITSIANDLGGLTMNCEQLEGEFGLPVPYPFIVTSPFGMRANPTGQGYEFHNGIDFGLNFGEPIFASLDGRVVVTQHSNFGYGNMVMIEHDNGMWTLYAHLQEILVTNGQLVRQGEVIATNGSTGNSTGPHLHYEIRMRFDGGQVDPAPKLGIWSD